MAELRSIPIRQAASRPTTFMGADRNLTMMALLITVAIIMPALNEIKAWIGGILFWSAAIFVLRLMAKADPLMRQVYGRHRNYARYYAARATPFRQNVPSQVARYRAPGERKGS